MTVDRNPVKLWELLGYFLRLGALGFGGPVALAGYMHRDLVPRGWITEEEFLQGFAFAQVMPGPLAAQLEMWIGFIRHGVWGASLIGIVFVLPAYLLVVAVAFFYVRYGGLPMVQALFYGIGPAVIAIVGLSALRLARKTVGRDRRLWVIAGALMLITAFAKAEIAVLFVLAGILGILLDWKPTRAGHSQGPSGFVSLPFWMGTAIGLPLLLEIGAFFLEAGAFTFGSGLAIVPFLHQGVVLQHHWLTEHQFRDAVAVGIITPGPVVITAAFVGYVVAGFWGSLVSTTAVFLPVYLFVLYIGRYIVRYREHPILKGFVKGATAAASGAIAGAAIVLGQGSVIDIPTAIIMLASWLVLWRFKAYEPLIILIAAGVGVILFPG